MQQVLHPLVITSGTVSDKEHPGRIQACTRSHGCLHMVTTLQSTVLCSLHVMTELFLCHILHPLAFGNMHISA